MSAPAGAGAGDCPACGAPLARWMSVAAGEPSDPRSYPLARCPRCATATTGGSPPGPAAYEAGVYGPGPPRAAGLVGLAQRAAAAQPVALLRRAGVGPGARVLDAGAGRGRLVGALAAAGFEARGIEPSARGAGSAGAAGLAVERASIEEHAADGLDAVVLWHVLEHLDEPAAALARVCGWLRPGGVLLVAVPNAVSWQARIAGPAWLHWDAPRHRVHLTPAGLAALLRAAGMEPERTAHMVWEHNPLSMWMALLSRAGARPGLAFHLLKRNATPTAREVALLALGVPLAPLAVALEGLAAAARSGGTIACVARRAG